MTSKCSPPIRLDELRNGQCFVVAAIEGEDTLISRLSDLGLRPGITGRIIRRAPGGGPLDIEVRTGRIAFRPGKQTIVWVHDKPCNELTT